MSLFKDMLGSSESLFRDEVALDYDYLPKIIPFREKEQMHLVNSIRPLLMGRNGKNVLIHGKPGIGKTAVARNILRDLENEAEQDVYTIYINCWKKNSPFKITYDICEQLGIKFIQNKTKEELFDLAKKQLNKSPVVFVFDEVDKLDDLSFMYLILEEIYRKTIFMITNYREWADSIDERIRSRLTAELLEFKPYNAEETKGILNNRMKFAFVPGAWEDSAFLLAANKAASLGDIRTGLYLLKEAGASAEEKASKKVTEEHVREAIRKLDEFSINSKEGMEDDESAIMDIVKQEKEIKIGDLYKKYTERGGNIAYRTFQRKVSKLEKDKFVSLIKTQGGDKGNTTIIKYKGSTKKLTDF